MKMGDREFNYTPWAHVDLDAPKPEPVDDFPDPSAALPLYLAEFVKRMQQE